MAPKRKTSSINAPSKIKILVVPVGSIQRKKFFEYFGLLQSFMIIKCQDLAKSSPNLQNRLEKKLFMDGIIQLDFVTEYNINHQVFEEFQYFRRVFGIIGIMDDVQNEKQIESYHQFSDYIKKFPTVVSHLCYSFQTSDHSQQVEGVVNVPSNVDVGFYIKLSIYDFVSQLVTYCCDMADKLYSNHSGFLSPPIGSLEAPSLNSNSTSAFSPHKRSVSFQMDLSSRVIDLANSVGLGTDTKMKKQSHGRSLKTIADLYLMSGRYPEASQMYLKAIDITRNNLDNIFYVGCLEGYYCTLLLLSSINADLLKSSSYQGNPSDLLMTIADSYFKEIIKLYEETPHPLLYIEAYLKLAKVLTVMWKMEDFEHGVEMLIKDDFDKVHSFNGNEGLVNKRKVNRSDVTAWAMCAWSPTNNYLSLSDKIDVFSTMADIFGTLGYKRKQSLFLRHAFLLVFPSLVQSSAQREQTILNENDDTIKSFLKRICSGYNIDVINSDENINTTFQTLTKNLGWVDLQKVILKECIAMSEAFSDFKQMGLYLLHYLLIFYPYLTKIDQDEIYRSLMYRIQFNGLEPFNLDISNSLLDFVTFKRVANDINRELSELKLEGKNKVSENGSFFFNTSRTIAKEQKILLAMNEKVELHFLINNPLRISLELEDICLIYEGVEITFKPENHVLPPKSNYLLAVFFTPTSTGSLTIKGLQARLLGCNKQTFLFNGSSYSDKNLIQKKGKNNLEFEIINPQPYVKISNASLAQPMVMLYEGESTEFSIAIVNESEIDVNMLKLSFEDSILTSASQIHSSISSNTEYKIERDCFISTPLLECINKDELIGLKSNESVTIKLKAFGKLNYNQSTLTINYGAVDPNLPKRSNKTMCRKKSYKVNFTILPTVIPISFDIATDSEAAPKLFSKVFSNHLNHTSNILSDRHKYCLLAMEFKNLNAFAVKLKSNIKIDDDDFKFSHDIFETISGNETKRVILPFKRYILNLEELNKSLPEDDRIVKDSNKNNNSNMEYYWYRRELLNKLTLSWEMPSENRNGDLSLDWIKFNETNFKQIKLNEVLMFNWVETFDDKDNNNLKKINNFEYECKLGTLIKFKVKLLNHQDTSIKPQIKLIPYLDYMNGKVESLLNNFDNNIKDNSKYEKMSSFITIGSNQKILPVILSNSSYTTHFTLLINVKCKIHLGCSGINFNNVKMENTSLDELKASNSFLDTAALTLNIV